jgi:hypothetical protein
MNTGRLERYLSVLLEDRVTVHTLTALGEPKGQTDAKSYGYGAPVRVDYETSEGKPRTAVLHTMGAGPFGHEHMADRAQILLWQNRAFNRLPRHVRALDAGGFDRAGELISVGSVEEFFLLTEFAPGESYASDLERILARGMATAFDFARAEALCDYLAAVHRAPIMEPGLYTRRIRELVGHGECIMGLSDSYPPHPIITRQVLEEVEQRAVSWRWKLKDRAHRLRCVHGDFHPWNILFQDGVDFELLDRSRGEYGDPADDVACLSANYIFFSLQKSERLEGAFSDLFLRFWDRYLTQTGDREMLEVVAPWFAFRALVMANPVWYPNLTDTTRQRLATFMLAVLAEPAFDPSKVNDYCGA